MTDSTEPTDTERLDWMDRFANPAHGSCRHHEAAVRDVRSGRTYEGRTLREAIDAALSAERG